MDTKYWVRIPLIGESLGMFPHAFPKKKHIGPSHCAKASCQKVDEISCTGAIMACGRASEWQVALLLLAKTPGQTSQKLRENSLVAWVFLWIFV